MDAAIQFTCPHCNHTMKLPSSTVGKQGKCPGCGQVVTISSGPTDDDDFLAMAFGTDDDVSDEEPMLLDVTSSSHVTTTGNSRTNNCSDCGGLVSVQVSTCPHCGAPTLSSGSTASVPSFTGDQLMRDPTKRLVKCKDCRAVLSKSAKSCPHCGHDRNPAKQMSGGELIFRLVWAVLGAVVIWYFLSSIVFIKI